VASWRVKIISTFGFTLPPTLPFPFGTALLLALAGAFPFLPFCAAS
jgi:hypothetical protein